ncbi:sigma-70 family RNA polymerase sigma factor [Kribbella sancticallisti]|uniref:Sigma-70 family RNA polymerase sigma factor n=1 Tax=Kribbella sancticallisti TaxID=460087 RepID=A0ABP4PDT3_9ACTN
MESTSQPDRDLVESARRGDAACLGAVLDRHRAALLATALTILGDRVRAEDAVQETYLVALRRLGDLRDPSAVGPWLRSIVRNVCRMELRSTREIPCLLPDRAGPDPGPEAELEALAVRDWVWTALAKLPEDIRTTVMLRYFTRRASYAEIADVLGLPVGTVRSRLNQGRHYLSTALSATAVTMHPDYAAVQGGIWRERASAVEAMTLLGQADVYFEDCAPEVIVSVPAKGYECRGVAGERRNLEAGLAAGVRMTLTRVLACRGVTIIEADYHNPPDDPKHCPPWHTEIRVHPNGWTTRLVLHFGYRPESRPSRRPGLMVPDALGAEGQTAARRRGRPGGRG